MQDLICIIGTDGSGKTTLADAVVKALNARGHRAERVWLGADNYLMRPVRGLLKLGWTRGRTPRAASGPKQGAASQRVDYAAEIARKNALAARFGWAVTLYLALVWLDYRVQVWIKRFAHRNARVIVADRYLFDVAVNLGLTLGWGPEQVVQYVRTRLAHMALPKTRVFLRVAPEVSMARKDDVFDVDYLRLRLRYYDAIAQAFGFTCRDGTLPIAQNTEWLLAELTADTARPYVIYVHANNRDIGGADKVLALMAQHMRDYGSRSRVAVALRLRTGIVETHSAAGVPVFLHPFQRPQLSHGAGGLLRFILYAPASFWFFWRLFGRERPDIVHVNDLYDFLPACAARLRGIPVVWHIRMIVPHPRLQRAFALLIGRVAPVSVSVSRAVRDHYFPVPSPSHRALVIHDLGNAALIAAGADPLSRPADLPQTGRLVVMVGRVEPWKGQHIFLSAIAALPPDLRAGAVFAIVGGAVDGKDAYFAQITTQAATLGVRMLGARDDVPALLRAADISVHASITPDPFPGVVIESLLAGAATIAADAGGAREMIEHGVHGLLCAPDDAGALAVALTDLLGSATPPRARFGTAPRQRALALVDAAVVDGALQQVYSTLTQRNDCAATAPTLGERA
jgi:glycosyltransferase involved in cell wall biosynthesis/thymidylate kinase